MPGRVGVLHHPRSFFPADLKESVGAAAELVWVLVDHDSQDHLTRELVHRLGDVAEVSSGDLDAAAEILSGQALGGIVTYVDDHLVLAAQLAQRLGLSYHTPEVAAGIANKRAQREALAQAGVPGPEFWALPIGLSSDGLRVISEQVRYPAVLKPAFGSGSRGILALDSPAALIAAYRPEIEQYVEEYLSDDPHRDLRFASYLSVESVVSHSVISHVAITGRFALAEPYRETGNFIPAAVTGRQAQELCDITEAAIKALGITSAVLHTEIKLTPHGPRVIELNGRLGGRPPFVLLSVAEVNLFQSSCLIALGEEVRFGSLAPCSGVGYWRMVQPPLAATRVRDLRGIAELARRPGVSSVVVNRGPGKPVDVRLGTDGAVVTVRGRVENLEELAATVAMIDREMEVEYEFAHDAQPG